MAVYKERTGGDGAANCQVASLHSEQALTN